MLTASLLFAISCVLPKGALSQSWNLLLYVVSALVPSAVLPHLAALAGRIPTSGAELTAESGISPEQLWQSAQSTLEAFLAHMSTVWYAYAIIIASESRHRAHFTWPLSRVRNGLRLQAAAMLTALAPPSLAPAGIYYKLTSKPPVYLLDFAVYEPPREWQSSRAELVEMMRRYGCYSEKSLKFMADRLKNSGTGDYTHWPPGTVHLLKPKEDGALLEKPDRSIEAARQVAEAVLCGTMQDLLDRTGVKAKDIDFLIVNCSLFCPTPSLCSIVARRFGMRPTLRTYNLGGMGCSAGVIAIDLAKQLLQNRANSLAVVMSTEEITQQLYLGDDPSMLLQNTLFRVGGSAVLLSNKPIDGFRAKYKLLHTVRVQESFEDAHKAVYQCQDPNGQQGIALSRKIISVAGEALKHNMTILAPQVLPLREQVKFGVSIAKRKLVSIANSLGLKNPFTKDVSTPHALCAPNRPLRMCSNRIDVLSLCVQGKLPHVPIYVPDFKRAINHFCIHAGGRAVIDGIQHNLHLEEWRTAPSRATLYHWGNTSSSSIWYELRYCEGEKDKRVMSEGDKARRAAALSALAARDAKDKEVKQGTSGAGAVPEPEGDIADLYGWDPLDKWYLPEYREHRIQAGERVLQIAFGSGFKCNSAVWLRLR